MENISITLSVNQLSSQIVTNFDFMTIIVYPTNNELAPRRMSKKDYSKRAGISERTLRSYLNNMFFPKLEKMGYSKNQRMLPTHIVAFLDYELAITPNEGQ